MPTWQVINRESLPGYTDYGSNAERMGAIGTVFPAILFLSCSTCCIDSHYTYGRRAAYTYWNIQGSWLQQGSHREKKYLLYALSATLGGSIVGVLIGEKLFPIYRHRIIPPYVCVIIKVSNSI